MTTIICYKDETVSMILADRRLNWGKNQEGGYDDTREKIVATLFGWASGGGFSDFSDIFISKLIRDKVLQLPELKARLSPQWNNVYMKTPITLMI